MDDGRWRGVGDEETRERVEGVLRRCSERVSGVLSRCIRDVCEGLSSVGRVYARYPRCYGIAPGCIGKTSDYTGNIPSVASVVNVIRS